MQMSTTYLSIDAVLDTDAEPQLSARWRPKSGLFPFCSSLVCLFSYWPPNVARGSIFGIKIEGVD